MNQPAPVTDVDTTRARELLAAGALLVDVREPAEWRAGHVADAMHVPLGQLDAATLPGSGPVVAVCRSGNRSRVAAELLGSHGREVYNLAGGVTAWAEAGLPLVADDGAPGRVA